MLRNFSLSSSQYLKNNLYIKFFNFFNRFSLLFAILHLAALLSLVAALFINELSCLHRSKYLLNALLPSVYANLPVNVNRYLFLNASLAKSIRLFVVYLFSGCDVDKALIAFRKGDENLSASLIVSATFFLNAFLKRSLSFF